MNYLPKYTKYFIGCNKDTDDLLFTYPHKMSKYQFALFVRKTVMLSGAKRRQWGIYKIEWILFWFIGQKVMIKIITMITMIIIMLITMLIMMITMNYDDYYDIKAET